jgi:hypothetical protein
MAQPRILDPVARTIRMSGVSTMTRGPRLLAPIALAAALVLPACGQRTAASPRAQLVNDSVHGFAVELPPGWQRATASLTPNLDDPREILSVATFPLRYRETDCGHVPTSALDGLGPSDAFVTLQERGLDPNSTWPDFPSRPAHFGPQLGGSNADASECAPGARFINNWFGLTDGGRHFHVLVAFGPKAPATVQRQAWQILDSLKIDPRVRPDWRSSG